jgi:hypothetical protein
MQMKKLNRILCLLFLCSFIFQISFIGISKANVAGKNIIILIDNSGSMKKGNSDKLSVAAASMLIDSVAEGTNLNIIGFGTQIMSPYQLIDKPSRESLKSQLTNLKFDNSYTNLKDGLKVALAQMEKVQGEKTIIILSDGKEEPEGGMTDEHTREFNDLIEKAHDLKIRAHTIALSKQADIKNLTRIAHRTDGDYFLCEDSSALLNVLSKIQGNMDNFYTIENYITQGKTDKNVKFSSYIEEVIIKVASCENKVPQVEINEGGEELSTYRAGDTYKVYKLDDPKSRQIKISSKDAGKNLIIVQVKSKGFIEINTTKTSFDIPCDIPLDVEAALDMDEEILGLHMYKVEGGTKEPINSEGGKYKFTFNKNKPGNYPILITAHDGEGNLVAVRDIDITVNDYPPFNYSTPLPEVIMAKKESYKIEIKSLKDSKEISASGEIILDYGGRTEEFPLQYENGVLSGEVLFKESGEVRISANIHGVKNNEDFAYYLPYHTINLIDKPFVVLEVVKTEKKVKAGESIDLIFNIKNRVLYNAEKIFILDSSNKKVGEFVITPETSGSITAQINGVANTESLALMLKPANDIEVTKDINTGIKVTSTFGYYFGYIISLMILVLIAVLSFLLGRYFYKKNIYNYRIDEEFTYSVRPGGTGMISLNLNLRENQKYLRLEGNSVVCDEADCNAIGSFMLRGSHGVKFILGLLSLSSRKRKKMFEVIYSQYAQQKLEYDGETISGDEVVYQKGIKVILRMSNKNIEIDL